MTSEELAAIKARAEAATPGSHGAAQLVRFRHAAENAEAQGHAQSAALFREAHEFIAHARTDVPALIAEVERLHRDIVAYQGALGHSLPSSHDGRLSDGSTPENVLARTVVTLRAEPAEAEVERRTKAATIGADRVHAIARSHGNTATDDVIGRLAASIAAERAITQALKEVGVSVT